MIDSHFTSPAELVEHIAETHRALLRRDLAPRYANMFDASENLLRNAILSAYPHLPSAQTVIDHWLASRGCVAAVVSRLAASSPAPTREDWYRRRVVALERLRTWSPNLFLSTDLQAELALTAEHVSPGGEWLGGTP